MKNANKWKWTAVILSCAAIVLGLILMIWPGMSLMAIGRIVGILALVVGLFRIVHYFVLGDLPRLFASELTMGLFDLVAALVLLSHTGVVISILPIILGAFVVAESAFKLQSAIDRMRLRRRMSWLYLLFSCAELLLGVMMIFSPMSGAVLMAELMGLALIVNGVDQLWLVVSAGKMLRHFKFLMMSMDDEL